MRVYLNVVRRKFAQGLKVEQSTDFYELLNNTPPLVHSPSVLFAVFLYLILIYLLFYLFLFLGVEQTFLASLSSQQNEIQCTEGNQ